MEFNLKLDIADESGMTPRTQLLKIKEQTGITPPILNDEPEVDDIELEFLKLFWKILTQATPDNNLSISQLNAWSSAYKHSFAPLELDYIFMLAKIVTDELRK